MRRLDKVSDCVVYKGNSIRLDNRGMVNLTDMWKAAGSPANKDPYKWSRLDTTQDLVGVLRVNRRQKPVLATKQGRGGGTWAVANLAIYYAKYLSPEFHAWANQVILERMEEETDPELSVSRGRERAAGAYRRQGKDERWIQTRIDGIGQRVKFTETLQEHGVKKGVEFASCTNGIYQPLLGGTAKELRLQRDLPDKANLRDALSKVELAGVGLSETLAEESIESENLIGLAQCERACRDSGAAVAKAVVEFRIERGRQIQPPQ